MLKHPPYGRRVLGLRARDVAAGRARVRADDVDAAAHRAAGVDGDVGLVVEDVAVLLHRVGVGHVGAERRAAQRRLLFVTHDSLAHILSEDVRSEE